MNTAEPTPFRSRKRHAGKSWSVARRLVMLAVFALFVLQYAGFDLIVGSLSGSVVLGAVSLLDVFAFIESQSAAGTVALSALVAVLPVVALYLIFGRAFCGWICPMDFLFSVMGRLRPKRASALISPRVGYVVLALLLGAALLTRIPLFSTYFSHLTNLFRAMGAALGPGGIEAALSVFLFSAAAIAALLVLELISPRLWCRVLCPVGKTYGLFNKISLVRLRLGGRGCSGCRGCDDACYMGVRVACRTDGEELRDLNCIYCGRCVEACAAKDDVVRMGFRRRTPPSP